jgi:hypothetical protein
MFKELNKAKKQGTIIQKSKPLSKATAAPGKKIRNLRLDNNIIIREQAEMNLKVAKEKEKKKIPVRIDAKTVIYINPCEDQLKAIDKFYKKINKK